MIFFSQSLLKAAFRSKNWVFVGFSHGVQCILNILSNDLKKSLKMDQFCSELEKNMCKGGGALQPKLILYTSFYLEKTVIKSEANNSGFRINGSDYS